MEELSVKLEHCYGIQGMEHKFLFKKNKKNKKNSTHVIYAGNGIMKTSFAKTFLDLSNGEQPKDLVFDEPTDCKVLADGKEIEPEQICVIQPYNEGYKSDKLSLLLANEKLRKRHADAIQKIEEAKVILTKALGEASKVPKADLEKCMEEDFAVSDKRPDNFFRALVRAKGELNDDELSELRGLEYRRIFNKETNKIIEDEDFRGKVQAHASAYNDLLDKSYFFKKGIFRPRNADDIADQLEKNGYFSAKHFLELQLERETRVIKNKKELVSFIETEKKTILDDDTLLSNFNDIEKMLNKNAGLRDFKDYLVDNKQIIQLIGNPKDLKQKLWKSYFVQNKAAYDDCLAKHEQGKVELEEIRELVKKDRGEWSKIIDIFNERFDVPFRVSVENKLGVIIDKETPEFDFSFVDGRDQRSKSMNKGELLSVLSQGERRALYLLDVIYETKARKKANQKTLYIIDDIADSFDYKNKSAIIEYLHELQGQAPVQQIILSHNFDFYRTVASRLGVDRECRWHATKSFYTGKISLQKERYQRNPFKNWKDSWSVKKQEVKKTEYAKVVASVPLAREIAILTDQEENLLSELNDALHYRMERTKELYLSNVISVMQSVMKKDDKEKTTPSNSNDLWVEVIGCAVETINKKQDALELEDKVALSIAIRLKAEEYIVQQLKLSMQDLEFIKKDQTRELIDKFKKIKYKEEECIKILDRVAMMTPELIHLNSFMYEPILDMDGHHLRELYKDVSKLLCS